MKFGYVMGEAPGETDALLADVAARLSAGGWPLAGAVQVNSDGPPGAKCHMDLHVLASSKIIRISQDLGTLSRGCRLDPAGLESAVGLAEAALDARTRLVIVNKFGKQELDGRGFRPLIGKALAQGIPVLTGVGRSNLAAFEAFSEGLAEVVDPTPEALIAWAEAAAQAPGSAVA